MEDEGKEGDLTLFLHNGRHKFKINMILLTFLFDLISYISVMDLRDRVSFSSCCLCRICWFEDCTPYSTFPPSSSEHEECLLLPCQYNRFSGKNMLVSMLSD